MIHDFTSRLFRPSKPPLAITEEVAESLWISPQLALERFAQNEFPMMPPTVMVLPVLVPLVNVPPETVNAPDVAIVVEAPLTLTVPPETVMLVTLMFVSIVHVPVLIVTVSPVPGTPLGLQLPSPSTFE